MKKVIGYAVLLFLAVLSSTGCEDSGNLKIEIHSPENKSVFKIGDEIVVEFTVTDDEAITTIAYNTRSKFGTGSIPHSELPAGITEYTGQFVLTADVDRPGTYYIDISATDMTFEHVVEKTIEIELE